MAGAQPPPDGEKDLLSWSKEQRGWTWRQFDEVRSTRRPTSNSGTRALIAYRLGHSRHSRGVLGYSRRTDWATHTGWSGYSQVRKSYAELFVWSWKTKQPQIRFHNLETAPLHVYRFLNHA